MKPIILNLACGFKKWPGAVNVDISDACHPDMIVDLEWTPWPWKDNSVDEIYASHCFEHFNEWWKCFLECVRILKPGGHLEIRVPDVSSDKAVGFRDHRNVLTENSFYGVDGWYPLTDAKASEEKLPMRIVLHSRIPHKRYTWMPKWLLRFCARHMRNFIDETRFVFVKT